MSISSLSYDVLEIDLQIANNPDKSDPDSYVKLFTQKAIIQINNGDYKQAIQTASDGLSLKITRIEETRTYSAIPNDLNLGNLYLCKTYAEMKNKDFNAAKKTAKQALKIKQLCPKVNDYFQKLLSNIAIDNLIQI